MSTSSTSTKNPPLLIEQKGDLFEHADDDSVLAHCVSANLRMGMGIAVKFRERIGQAEIDRMLEGEPQVGQALVAFEKENGRKCYQLVTKELHWNKPTYKSLRKSLISLRTLESGGSRCLVIPRLGCGLDRLEWSKVKKILGEVFSSEEEEKVWQIFVYYL